MSADDEQHEARKGQKHRPTGRLSRFAKLSSMSASVAARTLTQRVASAFQSEEASEESLKRSREKNAELIAGTFGELKGAAMKVGQMLSADPELLPDEFQDALKGLQSEAPPMDFAMAKQAVEDALGGPIDEFFTSFSEEPIGAASIGQVHRATTTDGVEVAVKVQYPGISDTIESDLKNLRSLMNLGRVHLDKESLERYFDEVKTVIKNEGDYLREADNLERFQLVCRDLDGVRAPLPIHELCRSTLLTMEFIDGGRLWDYLDEAEEADAQRAAERVIRAYITMVHDHNLLHADPHPGNFLVDKAGNVVFLDLGAMREYEAGFADGLLDIMEAAWEADIDMMMRAVRATGFRTEGIDDDVIYDWLEMILEPLCEDVEFDFGAWKIHDKATRFMKEHPSIMTFAPPPEAVFYLRVLAGLRGLLGRAGMRINAYQIARDAHDRLRG